MAEKNILTFVITWTMISVFALGIINFTILFPIHQGKSDIFDNNTIVSETATRLTTSISGSKNLTNTNLNLTADYDTEGNYLGDRSGVGIVTNIGNFITDMKDSIFIFMAYSFGSTAGRVIFSVMSVLFASAVVFYSVKNFRTGN